MKFWPTRYSVPQQVLGFRHDQEIWQSDLVPLTDAMTRFATSEVGTRAQGVYYSVNDVDDMKAMSVIFGPISQAYADATVGKDDPIKNANASANFTRMLYDMVGLLKRAGRSIQSLLLPTRSLTVREATGLKPRYRRRTALAG